MSGLLPGLYLVGLLGAYTAGFVFRRSRAGRGNSYLRSDVAYVLSPTVILLLAVLAPTIAQFYYPMLLSVFQRDASAFVRGEWWRLVTPLFIQDGGVPGAIFNLFSLALVGSMAAKLWARWQVVSIFFLGGIVGEVAGLFWQPIGAGNSVGNISLAASVIVACLTRRPSRAVLVLALLTGCAYVPLFVLRDIHGAAAVGGCGLAFVLSRFQVQHRSVGQH